MKIVALMPVKNEGWILKTTIPQLQKYADEILCLDAGSTDDTLTYLKSAGPNVMVRKQAEESATNYSSWRRELLDWGRERGGTHFVWLDADEAFTANFLNENHTKEKNAGGITFRDRLAHMKPGEKLAMQWLCLWKSPRVYRDDNSIWSNLYKDFIVCDNPNDPKMAFENVVLHEGRTPGPNTDVNGAVNWTKIPLAEGAVLHFQFVPFERFQMKQAYQRVRERFMNTASSQRINHKYSQTLDVPNVQTKPIPSEWLAGISGLETIANGKDTYYFDGIRDFFKKKSTQGVQGILYFEPMQIWHMPQLHEMFVREIGREPKSKTYPAFVISAKKALDTIKNKSRRMLK